MENEKKMKKDTTKENHVATRLSFQKKGKKNEKHNNELSVYVTALENIT